MADNSVRTVNMPQAQRIAAVVGGSSLLFFGLKRHSAEGWAMAALGGGMIYCGSVGYNPLNQLLGLHPTEAGKSASTSVPYELGVRIDRSITIARPAAELYAFWRELSNLPRVMTAIQSVRPLDDTRSHWVMKGPGGKTFEWDAEIINDETGRRIGWRSIPGSKVDHAGSVQFIEAGAGRGTVVKVEMQYNPPGGFLGAGLAKLLGNDPAVILEEDLRRFKRLMETGEIPTTEGQPRGPRRGGRPGETAPAWRDQRVHVSSEESFPASDSPSWTPEAL